MKKIKKCLTNIHLIFTQWRNKAFAMFASIGKIVVIAGISYKITQQLTKNKNEFKDKFAAIIYKTILIIAYLAHYLYLFSINFGKSTTVYTNSHNYLSNTTCKLTVCRFFYLNYHENNLFRIH